jgi:hypothetical protein
MTMSWDKSAHLTEDSHINGERSPAAAPDDTGGRLVQRGLGRAWVTDVKTERMPKTLRQEQRDRQ